MKYAIIESGGKQYKAVEGGTIEVDLLQVEPGKTVTLDQVLLVADGDDVVVGMPVIQGAAIQAKVVEHFKGEKTINFNYRPKKRIRQKTGHRQQYTRLAIEKIEK
jgi:large subunit ribosomal protein L21